MPPFWIILLKLPALCFHKETKVKKRNGDIVGVIDLAVGDDIMTSESNEDSFTMVTNVTVVHGSFDAHKFIMEDGKMITVTSPHLMLVHKDGELKPMVARDVQLHDIMSMEGGKMSKIVQVENLQIATKVMVETRAGTLYADGIFVTGMCGEVPPLEGKNANDLLMEFKANHQVLSF
jgi:hypothetical protein